MIKAGIDNFQWILDIDCSGKYPSHGVFKLPKPD